jgi:septum formation protein
MNPFLPAFVQENIVLASRSPRRVEILRGLGIQFRIEPTHISVENHEIDCSPTDLPLVLAAMKAEDVAGRFPRATVIGADTVVLVDGEVLGKPDNDRQAASHLRKLSGRVHEVITGLAIRKNSTGLLLKGKETTKVHFRDLTDIEIEAYVVSGEGRDKAGGYAIQGLGACLAKSVEGCFFNVVGLPISLLLDLLRQV